MTEICAACLLAAAGASTSLAGGLISERPAVEDARVLLYEGQQTPFGTAMGLEGGRFSLGAGGKSSAFAGLNAVFSDFGALVAIHAADLNADGAMNFADLNLVLPGFGAHCD